MNTFWQHISTRSQTRLLPVLVCLCLVGCGSRSERVRPGKDAPVVELSIYEKDRRVQRGEKAEAAEAEKKRLAAEQMAAEQKKKDAAEAEEQRRAAEQMAAEQKKKDAAAAADRQRQAFEQLNELPDAVSLVDGIPIGIGGQKTLPVSIGNVSVDDLAGFEIALAKPENSGLQIVKSEADGDRSWTIEATVKRGLDEEGKKVTLATIYQVEGDGESTDGELVIKPASPSVADLKEYTLLLRSALLLSATSPQQSQERIVKQINLVEATRGQSDSVTMVKNQNTTEIGLGVPSIFTSDSGKKALGINDLNIAIEVVSPCALDGQIQETTIAVTEEMEEPGQSEGSKRYHVPIYENDLIQFYLVLDAQFEKNILGGRLLQEVDPKLPPDRVAALNDIHRSVLLLSDDKKFEQAKKKQIYIWKRVFEKLCDYASYPAWSTASGQEFSKYVQQQLFFADQDVLKQVLKERDVGSIDALLQGVAAEISRAIKMVPKTYPALLGAGRPTGVTIRKQADQLNRDQNAAAQEAMQKSFRGFIKRLFEVCVEEYNKTMDEQREKVKTLVEMQTKIQVKNIYTDAFHDGERYEIVLVDENAKPAGNSGHGKQNAATLD
jgi:hypothetical protein